MVDMLAMLTTSEASVLFLASSRDRDYLRSETHIRKADVPQTSLACGSEVAVDAVTKVLVKQELWRNSDDSIL